MEFLTPKEVGKLWGPEFQVLAVKKPAVKFTETHVHVPLSRPIVTDDGETTVIKLKEPMADDLIATDNGEGEVAKAAHLLRVLSGVPYASVKNMRGRDFILCQEVIAVFMQGGQ